MALLLIPVICIYDKLIIIRGHDARVGTDEVCCVISVTVTRHVPIVHTDLRKQQLRYRHHT